MDRNIKILNIITRLNIAGGSIHVLEISRLFERDGYHSSILCGQVEPHETDMQYMADAYNLTVTQIPEMGRSINILQDLLLIPKVYRIIKAMKPDIVHTHTAKAGLVGRIAAKLAGVPVILHTFHGNNFRGYFGKLMSMISINLERILALISTKIIAISEQQRDELLSYRICSLKKLRIIQLGFDFQQIAHREQDKGLFKASYGIDPAQRVIAFVGRLANIKNPFMFIDIAKRVLANRQDIVFVFAGDGELTEDLKAEVRAIGYQEHILFPGFIKDLRPLYADTDILMLTSINEGTPVAIIEAVANRIPVISTRVGGIPNLIRHGESGFMFERSDKDAFAQTALLLLDDSNLKTKITTNAWDEISVKYSSARLGKDLEALFTELLHAK